MKLKTEDLLVALRILAWVAFIGLLIKAGAILISYAVSIINPNGAGNFYMGLNLSDLRQFSFRHYTSTVSFMIGLLALEAYIAYQVIQVLSKVKLANPFTIEVSERLERISYAVLETWVVAVLYNAHTKWLLKRIDGLQENVVSTEFIFMAGVVFVMAQIFKKGVEIQSENDLTI